MNLQEQISRIQEMIGVKKIDSHKKLISMAIESLKSTCDTMNSEDDEYVSFAACDLIDSNLKIHLKDVIVDNDVTKYIVDMEYTNYTILDDDSLASELQNELKKWVGNNKVIVQEFKNNFKW